MKWVRGYRSMRHPATSNASNTTSEHQHKQTTATNNLTTFEQRTKKKQKKTGARDKHSKNKTPTDESHGATAAAGSRRSAHAMDVRVRRSGHLEVDHGMHTLQRGTNRGVRRREGRGLLLADYRGERVCYTPE